MLPKTGLPHGALSYHEAIPWHIKRDRVPVAMDAIPMLSDVE